MRKPSMPKFESMHAPKLHTPRAPRLRIPKPAAAFGSGGARAFSDPKTMQAPDEAFSAAMALPQGGPGGS